MHLQIKQDLAIAKITIKSMCCWTHGRKYSVEMQKCVWCFGENVCMDHEQIDEKCVLTLTILSRLIYFLVYIYSIIVPVFRRPLFLSISMDNASCCIKFRQCMNEWNSSIYVSMLADLIFVHIKVCYFALYIVKRDLQGNK